MGLTVGELVVASTQPILKIVLLCSCGAWCARHKLLSQEGRKVLSGTAYFVFSPCLIFMSMAPILTPSHLRHWWPIMANMLCTICVGMLLGYSQLYVLRPPPWFQNHIICCIGLGNTVTFPIVMVSTIASGSSSDLLQGMDPQQASSLAIGYVMVGVLVAVMVHSLLGFNMLKKDEVLQVQSSSPALPATKMSREDECVEAQRALLLPNTHMSTSAASPGQLRYQDAVYGWRISNSSKTPTGAASLGMEMQLSARVGVHAEQQPRITPTSMTQPDTAKRPAETQCLVPSQPDSDAQVPSQRDSDAQVPSQRDSDAQVPSQRDSDAQVPSQRDSDAQEHIPGSHGLHGQACASAAQHGSATPGAAASSTHRCETSQDMDGQVWQPRATQDVVDAATCRPAESTTQRSVHIEAPMTDSRCLASTPFLQQDDSTGVTPASPPRQGWDSSTSRLWVQEGQEVDRWQGAEEEGLLQPDASYSQLDVCVAPPTPGTSRPGPAGWTQSFRRIRSFPRGPCEPWNPHVQFNPQQELQSGSSLELTAAAAESIPVQPHAHHHVHHGGVASSQSFSHRTPLLSWSQLHNLSGLVSRSSSALGAVPGRLSRSKSMRQAVKISKVVGRELLSPPVAACLLAIAVAFIPSLQAALFEPGQAKLRLLSEAAQTLADCCIPCQMMVLGATLAFGPGDAQVPVKTIVSICVCRLVVMPLLGCSLVMLAYRNGWFQAPDPVFLLVLLMHNTVPTAVNVQTMAAVHQHGDKEIAAILFYQYLVSVPVMAVATGVFLHIVSRL